MRRKEQNIAAMNLGGVNLNRGISAVVKPVGLKRYVAGGEALEPMAKILDGASNILEKLNQTEERKNLLEAEGVLKSFRSALNNSKSLEEFDGISSSIEGSLSEYFSASSGGKEFWNKHGENIIALNKVDVDNLRKVKEYDFGREVFNTLLADNQGLLRVSDAKRGDVLLENGVNEIDNTEFLSESEKQDYKKGYLERGILNLALSDVEGAKEQFSKYSSVLGNDFGKQIDEIEKIKKEEMNEKQIREENEKQLGDFREALGLWQQREKGEISKSDFYVLSKDLGGQLLSGDFEEVSDDFSLLDAYRVVKEMNGGKELKVSEVVDVGNNLIRAYRGKKISLDEAVLLQNQLMASQTDKNTRERLFDKEIDEFSDRIMGGDNFSNSRIDKIAMEEKAKVCFKIYDAYYAKKIALYQGFLGAGGVLNPNAKRRLDSEALEEVKKEFGYKEDEGGKVLYAQLKDVIKQNYNGSSEDDIWKRYYKEALFVENKKEALKKIAQEQQKLELSYPSFDSWVELIESDLEKGDRFYFKGRLAEIA